MYAITSTKYRRGSDIVDVISLFDAKKSDMLLLYYYFINIITFMLARFINMLW